MIKEELLLEMQCMMEVQFCIIMWYPRNLSIVHVHGTIKSGCSTGDDLLVTVSSVIRIGLSLITRGGVCANEYCLLSLNILSGGGGGGILPPSPALSEWLYLRY